MAAIHILVWSIVFCIPFFAWPSQDEPVFDWHKYLRFCFTPCVFMVVFYLNYFLLVDRLLFRKRTWAYIGVNILILSVTALSLYRWQTADYLRDRDNERASLRTEITLPEQTVPSAGPPFSERPAQTHLRPDMRRPGHPPHFGFFLLREGLMLVLLAGLALAIRMTAQWAKTEREKQILENARTEAELKNLKNQLNPHFLFNTLNNIYSLIEFNPDQARYAVESLSQMLRHVLYDSSQEWVPADREFAFMRSYIKLMALRLPPNASLEVDIPENGRGILIAPLLFINSVENAFKHGISGKHPVFIRIAIRIGEGAVELVVENSYFPRRSEGMGSGIGLENLKRRLNLLYPGRHELVNELRGDTYHSRLTIRL